jgi:hypothetical protein
MLYNDLYTSLHLEQRPWILWRRRNARANQRDHVLELSECKHLGSLSGDQLEFRFVGGSKPPFVQTRRFSAAAINFTKADAAFGAALSVVAAAP